MASIKHLYIIGNGFDIFTGLRTRYADFRGWLDINYPFIYENMQAAYEADGEWWNDFELQLGKLDIKTYINKFAPPEKSVEQIMEETKEKRAFYQKYNLPPNPRDDSPCANRLNGLLDVLQYCFERWVQESQTYFHVTNHVILEKEDSFFINFNYTDVLQWIYKIPEDKVLHIHGRASKHERLVFGHNELYLRGNTVEENQVCFELGKYQKNPYEHIYKYYNKFDRLKDIEYVHIYGFSFSPVDEDYIDWIYNNTPKRAEWEVSWFSDRDKERIDKFVLYHLGLKERLKYIHLDDIKEI